MHKVIFIELIIPSTTHDQQLLNDADAPARAQQSNLVTARTFLKRYKVLIQYVMNGSVSP